MLLQNLTIATKITRAPFCLLFKSMTRAKQIEWQFKYMLTNKSLRIVDVDMMIMIDGVQSNEYSMSVNLVLLGSLSALNAF